MKRLAAAQPDLLDVHANGTGDTAFLNSIAGVLFGIAAVVALIAVAGVFNTLLLSTRERVRDTATLKTLGMSPRQVIGMVATSAGFLALLGGVVAVPAGSRSTGCSSTSSAAWAAISRHPSFMTSLQPGS